MMLCHIFYVPEIDKCRMTCTFAIRYIQRETMYYAIFIVTTNQIALVDNVPFPSEAEQQCSQPEKKKSFRLVGGGGTWRFQTTNFSQEKSEETIHPTQAGKLARAQGEALPDSFGPPHKQK